MEILKNLSKILWKILQNVQILKKSYKIFKNLSKSRNLWRSQEFWKSRRSMNLKKSKKSCVAQHFPPQKPISYDFDEGFMWRSILPCLHRPPYFPRKLSGQISLYGKYLFLASCEAVELAKSLRLTHTLPFLVIFRADVNFMTHLRLQNGVAGGTMLAVSKMPCCIKENTEEEAKKHNQLAQVINKVINTLAILFIVIQNQLGWTA